MSCQVFSVKQFIRCSHRKFSDRRHLERERKRRPGSRRPAYEVEHRHVPKRRCSAAGCIFYMYSNR